jgi:hypothetical protein
VHHTRKAETADFVDASSGTHGIAGAVDFVLFLDRKRHANDAILHVTGRDILEAEYALIADEGMLWRLDGADLTQARQAVDRRRALEKIGDRSMDVYELVAASNDPVTATMVAHKFDDLDGDTAGKYLRRLAARGYIAKVGRGQYLKVSKCPNRPNAGETARQTGPSERDVSDTGVSEVSETGGAATEPVNLNEAPLRGI